MAQKKTYRELEQELELYKVMATMAVQNHQGPINIITSRDLPPGALPQIALSIDQAEREVRAAYDAGRRAAIDTYRAIIPSWYDACMAAESIIDLIDTLAALTALPQARAMFRQQLDPVGGDLAAAFERLLQVARTIDPALAALVADQGTAKVGRRIEGLQRFIAGEDQGEYLRGVVRDRGGRLADLIASFIADIGGRPSGMEPWRAWLAQRADDLAALHPAANRHRIARRMISELEEKQRRGQIDDLETGVLQRLQAQETPHDLTEFVRAAQRAYKKQTNF